MPRTAPGSRFPPPDHRAPGRSPQGRLRRRPRAAGVRPVLDPPGRSPRTWQLPGKQETPVTHARKQPAPQQTPLWHGPAPSGMTLIFHGKTSAPIGRTDQTRLSRRWWSRRWATCRHIWPRQW